MDSSPNVFEDARCADGESQTRGCGEQRRAGRALTLEEAQGKSTPVHTNTTLQQPLQQLLLLLLFLLQMHQRSRQAQQSTDMHRKPQLKARVGWDTLYGMHYMGCSMAKVECKATGISRMRGQEQQQRKPTAILSRGGERTVEGCLEHGSGPAVQAKSCPAEKGIQVKEQNNKN